MAMTLEKWKTLEQLCHEVLEEFPAEKSGHAIDMAIRTTGAFAASVAEKIAENN
jgi:hypothetical protein